MANIKWTLEETDYMRNNYLTKSDEEMARHLNKSLRQVQNKRARLGLFKQISEFHTQHAQSKFMMTDEQAKNIALRALRESPHYLRAKSVLQDDEVGYYEEKWVSYINSMDELTAPEKNALDILIMLEVRIYRFLRLEKMSQNMAKELMDPSQIRHWQREINECVDRHKALLREMNISREQRIKEQGQRTLTFLSLLRELDDTEKRNAIAREAAVYDFMAKEEEKKFVDNKFLIDTGNNENNNG